MGCSASRFDPLLARTIEDPSSLSSHKHLSPSSSTNSSSSNSNSYYSSVVRKTRSFSAPLVHHPALRKGDTNHLVCLTSSTYGSLVVVDRSPSPAAGDEFSGESSPDSVINTWELMEGLEGENDDVLKVGSFNSCCFNDAQKKPGSKLSDSYVFVEMPEEKMVTNSKPLWKHLSEESLLSKMDPNVVSSYQKALSSKNSSSDEFTRMRDSKSMGCTQFAAVSKSLSASPLITKCTSFDDNAGCNNKVAVRGFEDNKVVSKSVSASPLISKCSSFGENVVQCSKDFTKDKVVLYFTSLRGIRKTYEDCCSVRMILRGFRVVVDEKDISMDLNYRKELQNALGGKGVSLPQLFIGGAHIGGAEVVKEMHESGELGRLLDGYPVLDCGLGCDVCGESRFVPCSSCSGSRKVFLEEEGRMRKCGDCNENGLVRCPSCCSV